MKAQKQKTPIQPLSAIYAITNVRSGQCYIGSTTFFARRVWQHKSGLRNGIHYNRQLQQDWLADSSQIAFQVIEVVSPSNLLLREQYWLDNTPFKYNISPTAGSNRGAPMPKGWFHTDATKQKLSDKSWAKIRGISPEIRQRMSDAQKLLFAGGYKHPNALPVIQLTLEGEFIKEWPNISQAAKELGGHNPNIVKCLKGVRQQTLGFKWQYKEAV